MTTGSVKLVKLDHLREPGQRRVPYSAVQQMADHLNESMYPLPGPKGYLSPSTIMQWHQQCPHAIYITQILKQGIKARGLPAVFGQAQHSAIARGFELYRETGTMPLDPVLEVFHSELYDVFNTPSDIPWAELLAGKTPEEFDKAKEKKTADAIDLLSTYIRNQEYVKLCSPEEIESIEEDAFVVVNGIPIYFVADLVLTDRVIDWKFTSGSGLARLKSKVPFDIQLWVYEVAFGRRGELHVMIPPLKRPKAGEPPRSIDTVLSRRDPNMRMINTADFVEMIESIPANIERGFFEKRGVTFNGGCVNCAGYEVCTASSENAEPIAALSEEITLRRKSAQHVAIDIAAIKASVPQGEFEEVEEDE